MLEVSPEVQDFGPVGGVPDIGFIQNAPGGLHTSAHSRSILSEGQNLPFALSCNQDVVAFDLATPFTDPDTSHVTTSNPIPGAGWNSARSIVKDGILANAARLAFRRRSFASGAL